jgi:hypothetical protein
LIKAANDRGGEDNITAVVFTIADGESEAVPAPEPALAQDDPSEEDTLHPEDHVRLPLLDAPRADVTMVVSAQAIQDALAESSPAARPQEPAAVGAQSASFARVLVALIVIAALAGLIVLLVIEELPR